MYQVTRVNKMRKFEIRLYKFTELSKQSKEYAVREFNSYLSKDDDINDYEFSASGILFYDEEWK